MPRPGPRPYECVRRAWHSERHQPIRGSLIQEIFRIANEIHGPATKKNKEWQEKLPIVVLKVEEIMYSKANSEAEYIDLKTLWDRVNDAINTIIRLDESTETREFLPPCIEAALNLGCTPRRASRSERNTNPTCYLNSLNSQGSSKISYTCLVENPLQGDHANNYTSYFSSFSEPVVINLTPPSTKQQRLTATPTNENPAMNITPSTKATTTSIQHFFPNEGYPLSNLFSVYPLHYGYNVLGDRPHPGFDSSRESGLKISDFVDTSPVKDVDPSYDLSLRLGPLSVSCPSIDRSGPHQIGDVVLGKSREGSRATSFPYEKSEYCLREHDNVGAKARKRKEASSSSFGEDTMCFLRPKLSFSYLTGSMRNAGS